jgi:general secretion pathway protein D
MIAHLVAATLLVLLPAVDSQAAQRPAPPKRPAPEQTKPANPGTGGAPAAPASGQTPNPGAPGAPGAQAPANPGATPPANPGANPQGNAAGAAQPSSSSGQAGQGRAKIPPIQDVGNEYVLTFDETGDTDALNLEQFVKICQETTGLNFTYSEETKKSLISAKLRMFGQKRIAKSDFYSFFQIMMIINDFVCSKIGPDHLSVIVISSLAQGGGQRGGSSLRNEAVYVFSDDIDRYADQPATLVTTVIDLPSTDVRTLSNSMRTMFTDANTQQIIPVGNSNSLIITGFGSAVASIVKMLRFVDNAAANSGNVSPEFEVIPLEFASAEDLSETLGDLLDASKRATQVRAQGVQAQTGVTGPLQAAQGEAKILTDPRTNSLLVMAMPDDMPRIKDLVARLDVNFVLKERNYHIYSLENVEAEDLSKTLDDFIRDAGRIPAAGRTGQPNRPGQAAPAPSATGGSSSARNEVVVVPDKTTNSLLIAANRTRYDELYDLIRQLDKRQDQVLIETALVELTGQATLDLGVELGGADLPGSGTGSFGVTSFGMSTFSDTNGDGIPDVRVPNGSQGITAGILNGNNFNMPVLLAALQTRTDTNVLNVPSVLVNNTGSAKVVSTDEEPTTTITATGGLGGQTQENFKDYVKAGVTLQISPTISASRYLRLKISLEVSTFLGSVSGAIPPPRVTRTIDTTVNVPDGDTMVIGGIITDNKGRSHSGVPILGDLPILGYFFRRTGDTSSRTTLYFFVTPHIMRDRDFADLAEISYRKKLEAADTIGADRVRVIDPSFGQQKKSVDMRGLEVPLYRSPVRGEVRGGEVGIEPGKIQGMLKDSSQSKEQPPASEPPKPPSDGGANGGANGQAGTPQVPPQTPPQSGGGQKP